MLCILYEKNNDSSANKEQIINVVYIFNNLIKCIFLFGFPRVSQTRGYKFHVFWSIKTSVAFLSWKDPMQCI